VTEAVPTWTDPAYQRVAGLLGEQTGLAFSAARIADAEAGIRRAMARAGVADPAGYLQALDSGRADLDGLISELTMGETYFFREPAHWEVLRDEVLPALQRARPTEHVLRVWSAGCASGEEAYSLAILLEELGLAARSDILATDLSGPALEKARRACYGPWSLRGVAPERIANHFSSQGPPWCLDDRLRQRVHLGRLNLARDVYPSFASGTWGMDLILCRNVLIYLDEATVRRVARGLADCLAPGGWLLTGPSDPQVNDDGKLEPVVTKAGLFYRKALAGAELAKPPSLPAVPVLNAERGRDHRLSPTLSAAWRGGLVEEQRLSATREAFAGGEYARARALAAELTGAEAAALCVRAAANQGGPSEAERVAAESMRRHPGCAELQLLHAVLLLDLGREAEAAQAARRALYLDRGLVMGHFLLGTALVRMEDALGARKAFRNARALCAPLPADQLVPFGDGQRAAGLAEAAEGQLQLLGAGRAS
jgi:chemotaxis protein methyltransferase CheR